MSVSTNLTALETFYWVANLASFSMAAEQLHVTQPTVSYRIKELEERLGAQLIVRNGRKLSLTSEGETLRTYAEQMISIAQAIDTNVKIVESRVHRLRLGVIDSFAAICLPLLIERLEERFPQSNVAFTVHHSHNLSRRLSEGEIDLAILSTPPHYDNIKLDLLGHQRVDWVATPAFGMTSMGDLSNKRTARVFSTPAPSNIYELTKRHLSHNGHDEYSISTCNSISVIYSLIFSGMGIGLMPTRMIQKDLDSGKLIKLQCEDGMPLQDVFIATNKGLRNTALVPAISIIKSTSDELKYCIDSETSAQHR